MRESAHMNNEAVDTYMHQRNNSKSANLANGFTPHQTSGSGKRSAGSRKTKRLKKSESQTRGQMGDGGIQLMGSNAKPSNVGGYQHINTE
jgi:hypothetical protein